MKSICTTGISGSAPTAGGSATRSGEVVTLIFSALSEERPEEPLTTLGVASAVLGVWGEISSAGGGVGVCKASSSFAFVRAAAVSLSNLF